MHPVSYASNTHHDITDIVNHGMIKNTKSGISLTEHSLSRKPKNS